MEPEVRRYLNLEELNRDAAVLIARLAREAVARRGLFTVVLSGGKTPRRLYEQLARPPYDVEIPWSQAHLFWGDERCVPPTHCHSNYAMVFKALLSKVVPPAANVHRPPVEAGPPERAAELWEEELRRFFPPGTEFPEFDLVLLGVGPDGHTASLFPESPALAEARRWTAAVVEPRGTPPVARLTLTLPVLNRARAVLFLVSGKGKSEVVRRALEEPAGLAEACPAARVRPEGRLLWLLDGAFV